MFLSIVGFLCLAVLGTVLLLQTAATMWMSRGFLGGWFGAGPRDAALIILFLCLGLACFYLAFHFAPFTVTFHEAVR